MKGILGSLKMRISVACVCINALAVLHHSLDSCLSQPTKLNVSLVCTPLEVRQKIYICGIMMSDRRDSKLVASISVSTNPETNLIHSITTAAVFLWILGMWTIMLKFTALLLTPVNHFLPNLTNDEINPNAPSVNIQIFVLLYLCRKVSYQ